MHESGDQALLARYQEHQKVRFVEESILPDALEKSGRLQAGLSPTEALAVLWTMTGTDVYSMLVFDRGWTPTRYEEWLGTTLIKLLLSPKPEAT
jgi:hypothetical protein